MEAQILESDRAKPRRQIDLSVLNEIDSAVDRTIPVDLIGKTPRDVGIVHLLRFYENYNRLELPLTLGLQTDGAREGAKLGQDAFHFAMDWVHRFTAPAVGPRKLIKTASETFVAMRRLCEAAREYSHAWDYMNMMHRQWMDSELRSGNEIVLSYPNSEAEQGDVADLLLSSPDPPDWLQKAATQAGALDPAQLIKESKIQLHKDGIVEYKFPSNGFRRLLKHIEIAMASLWQLPPDWDVGGYTLGEFKQFWLSLLARCQIHSLLCFKSDHDLLGLESAVLVRSRSAWANELSRLSGVSYWKVQIILDDLIYDRGLYGAGKKQPDVTQQPFFCLGGDIIAPSNWLVILSNAERNLWGLLDIKRPEIHSVLRNRKEQEWIQQWRAKAPGLQLAAAGPIKFCAIGVEGDCEQPR